MIIFHSLFPMKFSGKNESRKAEKNVGGYNLTPRSPRYEFVATPRDSNIVIAAEAVGWRHSRAWNPEIEVLCQELLCEF